MRVLDKALLKTGLIDENEYAARELADEISYGGDLGSGYSNTMKVLAGLGIGAVGSFAVPAIVQSVDNAYAGEMVAKKAEAAEKAHASVPQKKDYLRVVVLDFEHGQYKMSVYYDEVDFTRSIPDQLVADLDGSNVRVIDKRALMAALKRNGYTWNQFNENPGVLAGKLDFDGVIAGSYTLNDDDLTIISKYIDMKTGEVTETQRVTGHRNQLDALVDRLGDEVKQDLGKYTNGSMNIPTNPWEKIKEERGLKEVVPEKPTPTNENSI